MATAIQLLRSAVPYLRPDPSVLADGMPMANLAPEEPGMFFRLTSGGLVKIGPAHYGSSAPNSTPAGFSGNTVGELWFDNTDPDAVILKVWNGTAWNEIQSGDTTESSPTPPIGPDPGDLWFDTVNGILNYWDGTQWFPITEPAAAGADTQVQFNSGGALGASGSLTFRSLDNKLTTSNLQVGFDATISNLTAPLATITVANVTNLNSGTADFTGAVTGIDVTLTGAFVGTTADLNSSLVAKSGLFNQSVTADKFTAVTDITAPEATFTTKVTSVDGYFSNLVQAEFGVFNQSFTAQALVSNTSVTAVDGAFSNSVVITNGVTAKDADISNQLTANIGTFTDKVDVVNAVTAGSFAIHTLSALPAPTP